MLGKQILLILENVLLMADYIVPRKYLHQFFINLFTKTSIEAKTIQ